MNSKCYLLALDESVLDSHEEKFTILCCTLTLESANKHRELLIEHYINEGKENFNIEIVEIMLL